MRLLLLLLLPRLALAAPWPHVPPVAMASAPPGGGGDDGARPLGLLGGADGDDDDPFNNSTSAPRDGRLNQSLCPDCGTMVSSSQLDMHRGRKRCLAQQKQNQLDRDYPNSCPKCAIALDPHNGENRRRHIDSCKPPAPAKKRKAPALVGGVSSKSQALMAGFFKRPAPAPAAAAAAPAPAAAPTPTPEPPALDGDFHDEAFGGIPDFGSDDSGTRCWLRRRLQRARPRLRTPRRLLQLRRLGSATKKQRLEAARAAALATGLAALSLAPLPPPWTMATARR